jgi:hypothetical protein
MVMAPKTEMGRACLLAVKRHPGKFYHQLSHEQQRLLLEEARREMREDVVEPKNTLEHKIMSQVGGRLDLGGLPGGARGEHIRRDGK